MDLSVFEIIDLIFRTTPAAVILSLALVVAMLACRQPVRRRTIARVGLLGLLLLPLMKATGPFGELDLSEPLRRVSKLVDLGASPERSEPLRPDAADSGWLDRGLRVTYAAVGSVGILWLWLGWYGSGWLTRRSSAPSTAVVNLYRSLPFRGDRRPLLRVSARVSRPVLIGFLKPTILIPPLLDQPDSRGKLRVGLLHELAHAEAADPCFLILSGLTQSVWFFLPTIWWIRAQARIDQEYLADSLAARGLGATSYASSLLDWAGGASAKAGRVAPAAPSAADSGSTLLQRMTMLLQCPFRMEVRPPIWWTMSVLATVSAASVGVTALRFDEPAAPARKRATFGKAAPGTGRLFRSSRLVLGATEPGANGRVKPVRLPVSLPDGFVLTFEIQASPEVLAQTRAVGVQLGPEVVPDTTDHWHRVRIVRDRGQIRAWIYNRPIDSPSVEFAPATRLSFEPPPRQALAIRDLILSW